MKCPKCGKEFEGKPERCPNCNVKFKWPEDVVDMGVIEKKPENKVKEILTSLSIPSIEKCRFIYQSNPNLFKNLNWYFFMNNFTNYFYLAGIDIIVYFMIFLPALYLIPIEYRVIFNTAVVFIIIILSCFEILHLFVLFIINIAPSINEKSVIKKLNRMYNKKFKYTKNGMAFTILSLVLLFLLFVIIFVIGFIAFGIDFSNPFIILGIVFLL